VDLLVDLVEVVVAIRLDDLALQLAGARQRPPVDFEQPFRRQRIARGIEPGEVPPLWS
jgi:hypothetical protein